MMFPDPQSQQEIDDRLFFEPVVELTQHKGASECRFDRLAGRGLYTEDELCDFEQIEADNLNKMGTVNGVVRTERANMVPLEQFARRNMVRNALKDGLMLEQRDGINPFVMGFIGSTDTHNNGEADDVDDIDPIEARNISQLYEADGRKQQRKRLKSLMASLKEQKQTPNGLCPRGAADRAGYGCYHLTLDVDTVALLNPKRHTRATFNDLLVAALHRTVEVWNAQQDNDCDLVRVSSPVNLRPKDWWFEVFGNFASAFATNGTRTERKKPKRRLNTIARQTRVAKDEGYAEAMLLALDLNTRIPVWMKNLLFQHTGDKPTTSAYLTNAGRPPDDINFGSNCEALEVWISPPAAMPDGIGVTHYRGRVHLAFRYNYELLDDAAMSEFALLYRESLIWLG
jgi:hypothetical protein